MSASLPGCVRSISLYPEPRWPVVLRNTRALHGVLTQIYGGHADRNAATFSLLPWPHDGGSCGWAVQSLGPEIATRHHVSIFNESRVLTLGPPIRYAMPPQREERDHPLLFETLTPIVIRHTVGRKTIHHEAPAAESLVSSLRTSRWISIVTGRDWRKGETTPLRLQIVGGDTHPETVNIGSNARADVLGKWGGDGRVRGWAGRLVLVADARTRWLLEIAQLVGLGGRISLGFGRFRIREVTR